MIEQQKSAVGRDSRFDRVVLLRSQHEAPARLLHGLDQRGMATTSATNVYDVMVAFANHHAGVLIIQEPTTQDAAKLERLTAALQRYYPNAIFWQYRESDGSGLTKYVDRGETRSISPNDLSPQREDPKTETQSSFDGPKLEPHTAGPRKEDRSAFQAPLLSQ